MNSNFLPNQFTIKFTFLIACGKTVQRNLELESCKGGIHRVPSLQYSQPWLVAIKDGDKLKCAGILISKEWILTGKFAILSKTL